MSLQCACISPVIITQTHQTRTHPKLPEVTGILELNEFYQSENGYRAIAIINLIYLFGCKRKIFLKKIYCVQKVFVVTFVKIKVVF